jgi:micrococcal nuclease
VLLGLVAVLLTTACVPSTPSGDARPRARHTRTHSMPATQRPTPTATAEPSGRPHHGARPKGPVSRGWRVYDVVDGDTVKVVRAGRELTVRVIGIDTPETVDPFRPVGCFGPEASAFAQRQLAARSVWLEYDPSQGRLDRYGRTLAYVWLAPREGGPWMYDERAVRRGYAFEYTYDTPYLWQQELQRAERWARGRQLGLWSPRTCDGRV